MAKAKKGSKVKNAQRKNIFSVFNFDDISKLAKQRLCPVCKKPYYRLHLIRKQNDKYYVYTDHIETLHYVAAFMSYDYVITNLKSIYYLYKAQMFSKQQFADLISNVFQAIATEAKEDEKFRKIILHSLKQLLELLESQSQAQEQK